jgi:hypothetical protein
MAKIIQLLDDFDGSTEDVQTEEFIYNGDTYTIDLSEENRKRLEIALRDYQAALDNLVPFVDVATKVKGSKTVRTAQSGSETPTDKIRAWAREQGLEVNDKGRIPKAIQDAYEEAHKGKQ